MRTSAVRESILTVDIPRSVLASFSTSAASAAAKSEGSTKELVDISNGVTPTMLGTLNTAEYRPVVIIKQSPDAIDQAPLVKDYHLEDLCPFPFDPHDRLVEIQLRSREGTTFETDITVTRPTDELAHQRLTARNVTLRWYLRSDKDGTGGFFEINVPSVKVFLPKGIISLK